MSTHNIGFYEDLTKIIFELSSNMHLISSAAVQNTYSKHYPIFKLNSSVRALRQVIHSVTVSVSAL